MARKPRDRRQLDLNPTNVVPLGKQRAPLY